MTLDPAEVERLVSAHSPTATGEKPDAAVQHEDWRADAYLDRGSGELVLVATGA
ncbi:hypothetical protein ACRAKI_32725 [Saccharothrix isguenensis]